MRYKKQGVKNRVIVIQKEKRPGCLFSFRIGMTLLLHPAFCTLLFALHILYQFFFNYQTLKKYQVNLMNYISGCRLIGRLSNLT